MQMTPIKNISLKVVQLTLDLENNRNRTLPRAKESADATLSSLSSSTARIAISTGINGKKTQTTGVTHDIEKTFHIMSTGQGQRQNCTYM